MHYLKTVCCPLPSDWCQNPAGDHLLAFLGIKFCQQSAFSSTTHGFMQWHSLNNCVSVSLITRPTILDSIKWNNIIIPHPPKSNDEGVKEQEHHWNGGRGGPDIPFILSKIVAVLLPLSSVLDMTWHHLESQSAPVILRVLTNPAISDFWCEREIGKRNWVSVKMKMMSYNNSKRHDDGVTYGLHAVLFWISVK